MEYVPTRRNIRSGGQVVRTQVSLTRGMVVGAATISPDVTSIAENLKRMRVALLVNIQQAMIPAAREIQAKLRQEAPWNDQPADLHNPSRGYPNDNASVQLMANPVINEAEDRVGIALYHSKRTYQLIDYKPVYYGESLENRFNFLREMLMSDAEPVVMQYMAGRVLEGISFKGARPTNRRPSPPRTVVVRRSQ